MSKDSALNASRMRNRNYRRILDELRISPFSRSELARRTGLTRAAISLIADTLLQEHIIVEGRTIAPKSAGRSSTELHWNKDAFYSIGIAVRRNYFGVGIYDFSCNALHTEYTELKSPYDTRDAIFARLDEMIATALREVRPAGRFLGIGIGAPGPIDDRRGIIDNPTELNVLHKAPFVEHFSAQYACPVVIKNDACTQALAERSCGVKDRYNSFLVMEITGGIGGGLILDGRLQSGTFGNGNELGHMTVDLFGPKCPCGNTGCAELFATVPNIVAYASQQDPRLTSWTEIVDLAMEGVIPAQEVVRREAYYIATLCVNMLNILDLDAIILSGREITYRPALLLSFIREQVPQRLLFKHYHPVDLITTSGKENADLLAAANLTVERYLDGLERSGEPDVAKFLTGTD